MEQITEKEQRERILKKHGVRVFNELLIADGNPKSQTERLHDAMEEYTSLRLRSVSETKFAPIQLCPKCHGDGNLGRYNSPNSYSDIPICDICNGSKTIPQFPVPVSEVGQMEKVEGRLEQALLYLRGNVSEENIAEATIHIQQAISLLPVPNTKTVEGEDVGKLLCAFFDDFSRDPHDSTVLKYVKLLSSPRSSEPEREGKTKITIKKEFELTNEQATERINALKKSDADENSESRESTMMWLGYTMGLPRELAIPMTEHIHKFMKDKTSSPPLKALSEITDEHLIEIAKLDGYSRDSIAKYIASGREILFGQPEGFPLLYGTRNPILLYQFLQHKGYAVPVFYPVPEVKEKGEACEICNGSGKHPLVDSPCVECQKEKGEKNE